MLWEFISAILPEEKAQVTQDGIYFKEHFYSSSFLIKDGWYERVVKSGNWEIQIFHDPACEDYLLIPDERFGLIVVNSLNKVEINHHDINQYFEKLHSLKLKRKYIKQRKSSKRNS